MASAPASASSHQPLVQALAQAPFFSALPVQEVEALLTTLREVTFEPGAYLAREGERGDQFYLIVDGELEIVKAEGTPEERQVGLRGPGEYVGEMSLFNPDAQRIASIRAHRPTRVLIVTRAELNQLLYRQPTLAYAMVQVMSQRLTEAHTRAVGDLQEKNRQLTVAYEALQAAQAQLIEKENLERELHVAASIQLSILPRALPHLPGVDLGGRMMPARAVGGDFYDAFVLDDHRLGLVIGDVTDKGVPAAIFMARTHAFWRAEATRAASPADVLARVNAHLLETNEAGLFVTMLYGILNGRTGELTYARAGHEAPLICDAAGVIQPAPFAVGVPLGILPQPDLDTQTIGVPAGGVLMLYTDGVTEARNEAGQQFGDERLAQLVSAHTPSPAQTLCDALWSAIEHYQGLAPQADDVTVLVARRQPNPKSF